eukprot:SAG31_NODE_3109_length_4665_cov_2.150022_4_plen_199_part_00
MIWPRKSSEWCRFIGSVISLLPQAVGSAIDTNRPTPGLPCNGYAVSGAGSAEVNGCYRQKGATYVRDSSHTLYAWKGVWRLGKTGHHGRQVVYIGAAVSTLPPESHSGGCGGSWLAESTNCSYCLGVAPCPIVTRVAAPAPPWPVDLDLRQSMELLKRRVVTMTAGINISEYLRISQNISEYLRISHHDCRASHGDTR